MKPVHVLMILLSVAILVVPSVVTDAEDSEYLTIVDHTVTGMNDVHPADIVIPTGVTAIDPRVFMGHTDIRSISFPDTLSSIGERAFYGCTGLSDISLPASLSVLGEAAFAGCGGPYTVGGCPLFRDVSGGPLVGNNGMLLQYPNDGNLYPLDGVNGVGKYAFAFVRIDVSAILTEEITEYRACAFHEASFGRIVLRGSNASVDTAAFDGCDSLREVVFGKGIVEVGDRCLIECMSLRSVEIQSSQTYVGDAVIPVIPGLELVLGNGVVLNEQMFGTVPTAGVQNIVEARNLLLTGTLSEISAFLGSSKAYKMEELPEAGPGRYVIVVRGTEVTDVDVYLDRGSPEHVAGVSVAVCGLEPVTEREKEETESPVTDPNAYYEERRRSSAVPEDPKDEDHSAIVIAAACAAVLSLLVLVAEKSNRK